MSFADKGIKQSGRTKDGKKFFDVKETRLMDILNVPITVVDFETNVKTKQGEGRYCVLFEQNGQRSKFITNCYNLKDCWIRLAKRRITVRRFFQWKM